MPKPAKAKSKKKASRKPARKKTAKKKTIKKKVTAKKKTTGKKPAKKKTAKKKAAGKKKAKKPSAKAAGARKTAIPKKVVSVEPGPQPSGIPSVEEPAANEEAIGTVTHYYSHLAVAIMQVNKGTIRTGDTIHIKGHTTDFTQQIESMEYEHQHVDQASAGQSVGLKVKDHAREHDIVYLVK